MRMYVGGRKYKISSLKTQNYRNAKELAFNEFDRLNQHIREKGDVFEKTNEEYLQDYLKHLDKELEKNNEITSKKTIDAKKTSLKKLKTLLKQFPKPSTIKPDFLEDYILWRRKAVIEGGNWNKLHKKNQSPPTDQTNKYQITAKAAATSTGASSPTRTANATYQVNTDPATSTAGYGWGAGAWDISTWGTSRAGLTGVEAVQLDSGKWSLDIWGEDLIAQQINGGL